MKEFGGSGAAKRFCTIQVTICAQADRQIVKIGLIFSWMGLRFRQSAEEIALYGYGWISFCGWSFTAFFLNMDVQWQGKAWADEKYVLGYLEQFRAVTTDLGEVMLALGMDRHGAQIFKTPMCMGSCVPWGSCPCSHLLIAPTARAQSIETWGKPSI